MHDRYPNNEENSRLGPQPNRPTVSGMSESGSFRDGDSKGLPETGSLEGSERSLTLAERAIGSCPAFSLEPAFPLEIDGYRLERLLGRGAKGEVWLAQELGYSRSVAIHFLDIGSRPGARIVMMREARVLASLSHPAWVRIYGAGFNTVAAWLILEYCPGGSLAGRLDRGVILPPMEAATMLAWLATGIHLAHTHGVIHREISLKNVLFGNNGKPRLSDFGLAGILVRPDGPKGVGQVAANLVCASPDKSGVAADILAMGKVLHHLLVRPTPLGVEGAVRTHDEPEESLSLRKFQSWAPSDLVNICLKCLEQDPRDRYASALALADDLNTFVRGGKVGVGPVGPWTRLARWVGRNKAISLGVWAGVALLIGLTLIGLGMAIRAITGG